MNVLQFSRVIIQGHMGTCGYMEHSQTIVHCTTPCPIVELVASSDVSKLLHVCNNMPPTRSAINQRESFSKCHFLLHRILQ